MNAVAPRRVLLISSHALRAEFSRNARQDIMAEASTEKMFQGFHDCVRLIAAQSFGASAASSTHDRCGSTYYRDHPHL